MTGTRALEIDVTVPRRHFEVSARLRVEAGERVALFGPSGAGKTTLLEVVAGLAEPARGGAHLGPLRLSLPEAQPGSRRLWSRLRAGGPTPGAIAAVSLVRQPPALFPHLDVEQNVSYGAALSSRVAALLHDLGLMPHRRARPRDLSGGQAQRVALARALARRFSVLLLDEPLSALDASARATCWAAIRARASEEGAAVLLVTHDLKEAQSFGDRVAVMDDGEILAVDGPSEVVAHPPSRRAAEVLGYRCFLSVVGSGHEGAATVLTAAVDPARVRIGSSPAEGWVVSGIVTSSTPDRSSFEVTMTVQAGSPVLGTVGGEWTAASTCDLSILVDRPVTVGKELLATVLTPPVVASESARQCAAGRQSSDRGETAIR
ncbi:MAG TPA: ABC transporter ATP-binding protein [Acidimicrobiales bacterium]|nr:ABC transporter ATP-binding protein [Acidimicrobiales bacterium]